MVISQAKEQNLIARDTNSYNLTYQKIIINSFTNTLIHAYMHSFRKLV